MCALHAMVHAVHTPFTYLSCLDVVLVKMVFESASTAGNRPSWTKLLLFRLFLSVLSLLFENKKNKKKMCRIVRKNVPARWIQKELHGVILWCAGKNEKFSRTDVQPSARNARKKNSVNKEKLSRTNVQPSAQNAHKKNSVNKEKCR